MQRKKPIGRQERAGKQTGQGHVRLGANAVAARVIVARVVAQPAVVAASQRVGVRAGVNGANSDLCWVLQRNGRKHRRLGLVLYNTRVAVVVVAAAMVALVVTAAVMVVVGTRGASSAT